MYSVIRRYQGDPTALAELARRIGESAHDRIATIPGFVAYAAGVDGKGVFITFGTYDDQAGASESTRRAAAWVRENASDLQINPPTVTEGETRLRKVVSTVVPTHGVIRRYQVDPANVDEIVRRANEGFVPLITQSPGLATYSIVAGSNGVCATASSFATREQAEGSVTLAASWIKANLAPLMPNPPEVTGVTIKVFWRK